MSTVALALTIILAVAAAAFYIASGGGSPWARDVCSLSRDLCNNPAWVVVATAGMAAIYLMLRRLQL
jgi:hypothetical protein